MFKTFTTISKKSDSGPIKQNTSYDTKTLKHARRRIFPANKGTNVANKANVNQCETKIFHPTFIKYWILNIEGMKTLVRSLQKKRYRRISTKNFNVDNVHDFVHMIKVANNVPLTKQIHESMQHTLINKNMALRCLEVNVTLC